MAGTSGLTSFASNICALEAGVEGAAKTKRKIASKWNRRDHPALKARRIIPDFLCYAHL